jgi:hypothetical protein
MLTYREEIELFALLAALSGYLCSDPEYYGIAVYCAIIAAVFFLGGRRPLRRIREIEEFDA